MSDNRDDAYIAAIEALSRRIKGWCEKNPERSPRVQFNFPENVTVLGVINDATERGIVTIDEDGRAMLDEVADCDKISVLMLRMALEVMDEIEEE